MKNKFGLLVLYLPLLLSCSGEAPQSKSGEPPAEEGTFTIDPARAATITGKVTYEGEVPPAEEVDMSSEPECAKVHSGSVPSGRLLVDENGVDGLMRGADEHRPIWELSGK